MSESLQALRRANPRAEHAFPQLVDAVAAQIASGEYAGETTRRRPHLRLSLVGAALAAIAVGAVLSIGSLGGGPGVEDAVAAVQRAAIVTAAAADRSGTVVIRITHDGQRWAGKTVRWNGNDMSIVEDVGRSGRVGAELRVVGGQMYGPDEGGGWVELGPVESIDPGSGTTPTEQLVAVREDVGGVTLRRITRGMTALTTARLADGSTVYRGKVEAGLIAREAGFKEGQRIRVFPFGSVAHDEASSPGALLHVALTVASGGVVSRLAVTWGTWTYTVTYADLGATRAPVAPENARPLRPRR